MPIYSSYPRIPYVSYFDLGATLYTPCTHAKLETVIQHSPAMARSMVYCLEDAVGESELGFALTNLEKSLRTLQPNDQLKRFIRVRNASMLTEILSYEHIHKVEGFVLPKFDLNNITLYQRIIEKHQDKAFSYMPTLETAQAFDPKAMATLADALNAWGPTITCLRIGGNDLINLLGLKRSRGFTAYDTPLRTVIDQLIITFRPLGYELSAPVFDFIDDPNTLSKEIALDIANGFYAKTAIHPTQVSVIEQAFRGFSKSHFGQAENVLDANSKAVFQLDGQMLETNCHKNWATRTSQLAARYNPAPTNDYSYAD